MAVAQPGVGSSRSGGVGQPFLNNPGAVAPTAPARAAGTTAPGQKAAPQSTDIFSPGYNFTPTFAGPQMPHGNKAGLPAAKAVPSLFSASGGTIIAKATTTSTQRQLANLGYNVTVDGILGPQTESALTAHSKGISATAWNAAQNGTPQPQAAPASTSIVKTAPTPTTLNSTALAKAALSGTGSLGVTPPSNSTTGGSDPATLQQVIAAINASAPPLAQVAPSDASAIAAQGQGLTNNQINAQGVATAAANAQYNPAISGLQSQVKTSEQQASTDQGDITGWYQTLVNNMNQRAAQEQTSGANTVAQISSTAPGTSAALGFSPGSAGGQNITAGGVIQANAAAMGAQANNDFNSQLAGVTQAQGVADQTNQLNIDRNKTTDLQNQLIAQQQARGQDVTALTAQNRQQNATNQNSYVNSKIGLTQAEAAANAAHTTGLNQAQQQLFANKQAGASSLIAAQAAGSEANLQNAEAGKYTSDAAANKVKALAAGKTATASEIRAENASKLIPSAITKNTASAQAALTTAAARVQSAKNGAVVSQADLVKARTAANTASSKASSIAAEVFPGVTGTNTGKVTGTIQTGLLGNTKLFSGTGSSTQFIGTPQALANAVQQQMRANGADITSPQAKQYGINLMQMFGVNPTATQAAQWFNYGKAPKAAKTVSAPAGARG